MAISPYLDSLLTDWVQRGNDLRKETDFQKDLIAPAALAAHGNRLAMRERRQRDLLRLAEGGEAARNRWEERLQRIQEWRRSVRQLQAEDAGLRQLIHATLWLRKARTHQDSFTRRLENRAQALSAQRQAVHERLITWASLLEEREGMLQDLAQKREEAVRPFYVSRARKQPEIDFMNEQRATLETLGKEVQQQRRSLSGALGRLQKAFQAVERQAAGQQILYEMNKQEIVSALRNSEQVLQTERAEILSDALIFEGCRHIMRRLQDITQGLRCIEDIPKSAPRGWRKFLPIH